MRIDCPACDAVYEVPDSILTSGPRALRCAGCGKTWVPDFAAPAKAKEAPPPEPRHGAFSSFTAAAPPEPQPERQPARQPEPQPEPAPEPQPQRASEDRDLIAMLAARADTNRGLPAGVGHSSRDGYQDAPPRFTRTQKAPPARQFIRTEAAPQPADMPAAIAASAKAAPAAPRPSLALIVAWLATLGSVGAVLVTFMVFPQMVMESWPAATRLYQVIGLVG